MRHEPKGKQWKCAKTYRTLAPTLSTLALRLVYISDENSFHDALSNLRHILWLV